MKDIKQIKTVYKTKATVALEKSIEEDLEEKSIDDERRIEDLIEDNQDTSTEV